MATIAHEPSCGAVQLRICCAGVVLLMLCAWLSLLSWDLTRETTDDSRPILTALLVLSGMSCVYLASVSMLRSANDQPTFLSIIVGFAVLFRVTLLFSMPILEIDLYRYIWDGAVMTQGVNPYAHSPKAVIDAEANSRQTEDDALAKLVTLQAESPALATILRRVHYPELTTVYPPVSQVFFAAAVGIIPAGMPDFAYVLSIKLMLICFDLATMAAIVGILR